MTWLDLLGLIPQLLLLVGATTLLLAGAWYREPQPLFAGGVLVALLAALAAGTCPPPTTEIAGLFHSTPYARFFTIFWALLAACSLLLSLRFVTEQGLPAGEYIALVLFAATGMTLLSAASSLVGLFLGLEALTLAFYILIACNRRCPFSAEAGLKYLLPGAVATGFLAFGIALIYATTGTFALPDALHGLQGESGLRPWGLLGWGLFFCAVGFKISLVPFHLWTPDVYQGAPAPVAGLLATGSKGSVVAALIGMLLVAGPLWHDLTGLLATLAAVTMLTGAFTALVQTNLKRLLAYSSVVHMGTLMVGLLTQTPAGLAASIFYIVVYVIASLGCFSVIVSFAGPNGELQELENWRGLGRRYPVRGTVLALLLLSLAGLPATAGFMAKFAVFHAALQAGLLGLTLIGLCAALVSFAFYLRVIMLLFMADESSASQPAGSVHEHAVLAVCASAVVLFGLFPGILFDLIQRLLP
ncbi:MAG: NADH-quinone oxidoreductase subunit N [Desulfuromonadales bacterium]|nr:NADH-quinone oxidoreductase subunit N [Desulfuromonadales bacterium]